MLINPGPFYKIKDPSGGLVTSGVFIATDREAILQCEEGMVFLGRRERQMDQAAVLEPIKPGAGLGAKATGIPENLLRGLPKGQRDLARKLALAGRQHIRSLQPPRPPLRKLAEGGHVLVLCVGTRGLQELRLGMEHFVRPLRRNLDPEEAAPIVIMAAMTPQDWYSVDGFMDVYFLQGSPTSLFDLERANFSGASKIFICHSGCGRVSGQSEEDWSMDAEVICCARIVESRLPKGATTPIIADITADSNHPFLPLPGAPVDRELPTGPRNARALASDFRASMAQAMGRIRISSMARGGRRESSRQSVRGSSISGSAPSKKRPEPDEYYLQPRFAAGELFVSSVLTSLVANTFYNPSLCDLVRFLVSAQITMVPLLPAWVGKPYIDLFDHLLFTEALLGIGIFRTAQLDTDMRIDRGNAFGSVRTSNRGSRMKSTPIEQTSRATGIGRKFSFVYTAPPGKETIMAAGDQVICFQVWQGSNK